MLDYEAPKWGKKLVVIDRQRAANRTGLSS